MSYLFVEEAFTKLQSFIELGGSVVAVILLVLLVLWYLILERFYFIYFSYPKLMTNLVKQWQARSEHDSWRGRNIKTQLVAQAKEVLKYNISTIKTLILLCPLLGLLGTVLGMIDIFAVIGNTHEMEAKRMAAGVSKATIPTMVGLVVSLSGFYFNSLLHRLVEKKSRLLSDKLQIVKHPRILH